MFTAVIEPDDGRWSVWCPALLTQGASTWGHTREEALRNLEEVVSLVVESLQAHGEPIPKASGAGQ
jgi:predicted RNase H-like HicB family nuclease